MEYPNMYLSDDELYEKAVALVVRDRNASISFLQRQLQIGFGAASWTMERLEQKRVVVGNRVLDS